MSIFETVNKSFDELYGSLAIPVFLVDKKSQVCPVAIVNFPLFKIRIFCFMEMVMVLEMHVMIVLMIQQMTLIWMGTVMTKIIVLIIATICSGTRMVMDLVMCVIRPLVVVDVPVYSVSRRV
jgi:hypothetical protein